MNTLAVYPTKALKPTAVQNPVRIGDPFDMVGRQRTSSWAYMAWIKIV